MTDSQTETNRQTEVGTTCEWTSRQRGFSYRHKTKDVVVIAGLQRNIGKKGVSIGLVQIVGDQYGGPLILNDNVFDPHFNGSKSTRRSVNEKRQRPTRMILPNVPSRHAKHAAN